ncbi:MAG TPA: type II toxin-antitoxin system VapC family toxin [Lamprocystis sp. (in: g-proteobacteria)]|nr:type II toxin-antitoxin system VapC family toxin [Lamprocystis sp. (in: g-proteobacteria)]
MILVDTSVWIDYLRVEEARLTALLERSAVVMHPLVLGELACGTLQNRERLLGLWRNLPSHPVVTDTEALFFLERHRLWGRGIGYIDLHLLASVSLSGEVLLWTRDKRLRETARLFGLAFAEADA